MKIEPYTQTTAELALRVSVNLGAASYSGYLVEPADLDATLTELRDELSLLGLEVIVLTPKSALMLLREFVPFPGVLVVDSRSLKADDWSLLDRQRSRLQSPGAVVFLATPSSFAVLMRTAPNLASWLGADVFLQPNVAQLQANLRTASGERLEALRKHVGMSDEEVIQRATAGTLPRDPEFAEWLVLRGREDLLDG